MSIAQLIEEKLSELEESLEIALEESYDAQDVFDKAEKERDICEDKTDLLRKEIKELEEEADSMDL